MRLEKLVEEYKSLEKVSEEAEGSVAFAKCEALLRVLPNKYFAFNSNLGPLFWYFFSFFPKKPSPEVLFYRMKAALKMYKENPVKDIAKFPFAGEEYWKLKSLPVMRRLSAEDKAALEQAEILFRGQQLAARAQQPAKAKMNPQQRKGIIDEIVEIGQFDRGDVERVFDHFGGNKEEILNHLFEQMEIWRCVLF